MKLIKITAFVLLLIVFNNLNDALANCNGGKCHCTVNSPNIAFGTVFNPLNNTALQQTFASILTVICTLDSGSSQTVGYTISFAAGTHGTIANRFMQSSTTNTLNFNVYKDSGFATILGTAAGATIVELNYTLGSGGCASPCSKSYTIYGQIPAQPSAYSDVNQYTDAIGVTLTY